MVGTEHSITYFPYDCDTFSLSDVSQVQNQLLQILSSCFWHMFSLLKIAEILNVHDNRDHVCFVSEDKTSSLARVAILGDPGAVSGGGKKSKRVRNKFGRRKAKNGDLDFSSPEFISRPLRLFPALTNCPWVSEDACITVACENSRPSSLPARVASTRNATRAGSEFSG